MYALKYSVCVCVCVCVPVESRRLDRPSDARLHDQYFKYQAIIKVFPCICVFIGRGISG